LKQHKTGQKSKKGHNLASSIVTKYGTFLRSSLYDHLNPLPTRKEALLIEEKLALELRSMGYAVWFN